MSFQAMAWAVRQKVGNATGKAILLMLANYAHEEGRCFPSQTKLAAECECGERTIREWLVKFEGMGVLTRGERRRLDGRRTSDTICLSIGQDIVRPQQPQPAKHAVGDPASECADPHQPADAAGRTSPADNSDFTGRSCRALNYQRTYQDGVGARAREPSEFHDVFWLAYPHKVGKGQARSAWKAARRKASLEAIMDGLWRYVASKPARISWCNPATWLTGERWLDQPVDPAPPSRPSSGNPPKSSILDKLHRQYGGLTPASNEGPMIDGYAERR